MKLITLVLVICGCGTQDLKRVECLDGCAPRHETGGDTQVPAAPIPGPKGASGGSCEVVEYEETVEIVCPESEVTIKKPAQGEPGTDGSQGDSCTIEDMIGGAIITCGDQSVAILDGQAGTDGADGEQGPAGPQGPTGPQGEPGADAPVSAYSVVEIINPCGHQTTYDEILLRLGNGQLLAHYSHGNEQFLTVIGPGSYVTTDGTSCYFSISPAGIVTW